VTVIPTQKSSADKVSDGVDRAACQLKRPPGDVLGGLVDAVGRAQGKHLLVHRPSLEQVRTWLRSDRALRTKPMAL
jgi:hypothetical protein